MIEWLAANLIASLFRCAFAVFVMLSGAMKEDADPIGCLGVRIKNCTAS